MKPLTTEVWSSTLAQLKHMVTLSESDIPLKNLNPAFTKQMVAHPHGRDRLLAKAFIVFEFVEKVAHPEQTPPFSLTASAVQNLTPEKVQRLLQHAADLISELAPLLSEEIPDGTPFLSMDTFITTDGRTDTTTYLFHRDTFLLEEGGYNSFLDNVEIVKNLPQPS